jgi:hypothetical protein
MATERLGRQRGLVAMLLALAAAMLACTLSAGGGGDDGPSDSSSSSGNSANSGDGRAPVVNIVAPASGTRVAANERVDVSVATDITATSFLLNVNGRVASMRAMPEDQTGPSQAILTWAPKRVGTYSLEVIAFNGAQASAPASILLEVSGTASSGPDGTASGCTGRVMVSELNFRSGPGTGAQKLGQFDVGETVTVIGRNADTSWLRVQRPNAQQVWVINNENWLLLEGECSSVPVTQ